MKNIVKLLGGKARRETDKIVFTFLDFSSGQEVGTDVSYGGLWKEAGIIASNLLNAGLSKGDRVIILSDQSQYDLYSIFGVMMAGGIFTLTLPPVDTAKQNRLLSVAKSAGPKFIIVNNKTEPSIKGNIPGFQKENYNIINCQRLEMSEPSKIDISTIADDDIAYLQFSSGSTNEPKGVIISHRNLWRNLADSDQELTIDESESLVNWVPFVHGSGLIVSLLLSVYSGRRAYLLSTADFMGNPARWFMTMAKYRCEMTIAPNAMYALCAKVIPPEVIKSMDLSCVRHLLSGSDMVIDKTLVDFAEKFAPSGVRYEMFTASYGTSEVVCGASMRLEGPLVQYINADAYKNNKFLPEERKLYSKPIVSQGGIFCRMNIAVVNPHTLLPCAPDEIGELWLQGDSISLGYWEQEEETKAVHGFSLPGHDGTFYRTGDLGVVYDGEVYITGRCKDIIIINGHNVYPNDIKVNIYERVSELSGCDMAIFPVLSGKREKVIVCIEYAGEENHLRRLSDEISRITSEYYEFSPYEIIFTEKMALHRTDSNKIKTYAVKEAYEESTLRYIFSSRSEASGEIFDEEESCGADDMQSKVKAAFEAILGRKIANNNESFLTMGGDSFDMLHLLSMLEEKFMVGLDIKKLMEFASVNGISSYIRSLKESDMEADSVHNTMYEDCLLNEDIQPQRVYNFAPTEAKNLFLTGGTGFLGAHLIESLLKGNSQLKLYCLVRAADNGAAMARIKLNMEHYRCWSDDFKSQIFPIVGDLSKPLLGLSEEGFAELCENIDAIYHSGAVLNFLFPYNHLKTSNVYGTGECLRLSCMGKAKYFHYISTIGVFDNPSHSGKTAFEADPLVSGDGYSLAYSQTKWVSEKLVNEAQKRGLRAAIYRPGEITGSSKTGIWNLGDLISRFLVGCLQMKEIPDIPFELQLVPVDFVADSIAYLSRKDEALGKAFNIVGSAPASLSSLGRAFSHLGYEINVKPYEHWKKTLAISPENVLHILATLFKEDEHDTKSIVRRFSDLQPTLDISQLKASLEGSGIKSEMINAAVLKKYLYNFAMAGFIHDVK